MKTSKVLIMIGLILASVMSLTGIVPAQERPFKGSYTATYRVDSTHSYKIGNIDFTNIRPSFTGQGTFSPLDRSNVTGSGIWVKDKSVSTLRDEITITDAKGNRLYARVTGTQRGEAFKGNYIIWGGTGPFAGAIGRGTVSGKINGTSISHALEGTITSPAPPPPPPAAPTPPASATGRIGQEPPRVQARQLQPTYAPTSFWAYLQDQMIIEKDVPVPTRDGLRLAANVYRPNRPGKFPVVLTWNNYGKDYYWQYGYPGHLVAYEPWSSAVLGSAAFEAPDPAFWVPHDYAVVEIDPTGMHRSPGRSKPTTAGVTDTTPGVTDSWDVYDAIEWAGAQEWSNGCVGTSGVSALGGFQLRVAALNPPSLKAISPWEGSGYSEWAQGGIDRDLLIGSNLVRILPHVPAWDPPAEQDQRAVIPDTIPWHEQYAGIKAPMLVGASWSSHGLLTGPAFNQWRFVGSEKWLFTHGREKWAPWYSTEFLAMNLMFFDYYLKGTDNRWPSTPRVRLETREDMYTYGVRWENEFPLPGTQYRRWYLDARDGKLAVDQPNQTGSVSYTATTEESAKFDYTFTQDTELTGYMKLRLFLAPEDHDDADVFVTLRKFDRNGKQVFFKGYDTPYYFPVAHAALRLSNRELDPQLSTDYFPNLRRRSGGTATVKPGATVPLDIGILPTSTLFRAGEKLQVEVSGAYRPGDKMTYTYPALTKGQTPFFWLTLNKGKHTIRTGGDHASYLLVPVVSSKARGHTEH